MTTTRTIAATIPSRTTGISEPEAAGPGLLEAVEKTCPNCDAGMDSLGCKLKCPRCGYFKSCSDF